MPQIECLQTQAETDITSLAINDPSRQMFSIPASLPEGTYKLKVETYFSTNNQRLKSVRTIEYDHDLVIGTLPVAVAKPPILAVAK